VKYLLSWSGGLDSTATAYKLLSEGHQVHFHCSNWDVNISMTTVEKLRRPAIIRYLKDQFGGLVTGYTWSEHNLSNVPGYKKMNALFWHQMSEAFEVAQLYNCDKVAFGAIEQPPRYKGPETPTFNWLVKCEVLRKIHRHFQNWSEAEYELPVGQWYKNEAFDSLPRELYDLTWSCHYPQINSNNEWEPCGLCFQCREYVNLNIPPQPNERNTS